MQRSPEQAGWNVIAPRVTYRVGRRHAPAPPQHPPSIVGIDPTPRRVGRLKGGCFTASSISDSYSSLYSTSSSFSPTFLRGVSLLLLSPSFHRDTGVRKGCFLCVLPSSRDKTESGVSQRATTRTLRTAVRFTEKFSRKTELNRKERRNKGTSLELL